MNLATHQVKDSVELWPANNGTILKGSIASTLGLSIELMGARRTEISRVALEFCLCTGAKMK